MIWLTYFLIGSGMAFHTLGAVALHRFPDVYTRLHGITKCATLGSILLYLGVILYASPLLGDASVTFTLHVVILVLLVMLTSPTGAHAIARASHKSGILPEGAVVDMLEEKEGRNDL
ncbi:MAG: monovalent cation/H(+) antiporter subunit G [Candidatus Aenigmarchaeota archaeon]|nr:monovalent cation/H(+) antiporter subunit G [Candidatus Aenigmarchaeota archaeon]